MSHFPATSALARPLFNVTGSTTVTNTVTETTIIGAGNGSLTLPANFLTAGKMLRVMAGGIYSTPAITAGSVTIKIKLGSTVIASGTASGLLISASSAAFSASSILSCRTVGASGTVMIDGHVDYSVGNNLARFYLDLNNGGATTTIDTTTSQALDVTANWDTASASKILTTTMFLLESLN